MSSVIQKRWLCGPVLIFVSIYIDKAYCMYTNSLEQNGEDCSRVGSFCGGHSLSSCTLFCVHRGHASGNCEGSCCTCYDDKTDEHLAIKERNKFTNNKLSSRDKFDFQTSEIDHFDNTQNTCTSPTCIQAAHQLKENMNQAVDPCQNFYEFACGNFIKRTNIPSHKNRVTVFTMQEQKVEDQVRGLLTQPVTQTEPRAFKLTKEFYKSCMNTDFMENFGTEPLKSVLKSIGGWPVLYPEKWDPENFHWLDFSVISTNAGLPGNFFVKFDVKKDVRNPLRRIITIGEPSLELSPDVLYRGLKDMRVRAYYKFMTDMAVLLGANEFTAEKDMLEVLEFEQSLAHIFTPLDDRHSANDLYHFITISELESNFPSVNWLSYIQRLFPNTVHIDSRQFVIVESIKYIERLLRLLSTTPRKIQSNYASWRAVASSAIYLNDASRRIYAKYASVAGKSALSNSRSSECIEVLSKKMKHALGSMYIRRYSNSETKMAVEEMVNDIRTSFVESLNAADWMEENTLEKAKEKAWAMYSHIAYPTEHLDDEKIDTLFEKLNIKENLYFKNILAITKLLKDYEFGKLRLPMNRTDWTSHGNNAVANAFYHASENSIVLPAAILQGRFFEKDRPNYLNYGSIGWIIGHEIIHGFDIKGHMYDKNGEYRNWWDLITKRVYESKTQCFVKQYGKFEVGKENLRINGVSSQGENVADNVGIKEAYKGYLSWVRRNGQEKGLPGLNFTPNQLFWISAANNWCSRHRSESIRKLVTSGVHVPEEYRVVGSFSNSLNFASDFKCPTNSRMNPPQKCDLW